MTNGLIVRSVGTIVQVAVGDALLFCTLRGRLKKTVLQSTAPLAVGDEVEITQVDAEQGVVEAIRPRHSKLSRLSPGRGVEQVLVANVDQAIIVMASYKPDFNPRRLDRYLVATHNGNITPVVCINKVDLVPAAKVSPEMEPYVANGIQVIYTSAEDGTGLDQLRAILRGKVSAMVGSSGVGKSSLINAIDPELSLRTQEIRNRFYKGQHTTTAAELLRLDIGGFVVDTPGMREFGLWQRKQAQVVESFDEFGDYASQCKFRNCTHSHEPGCAVKVAVANGEIDESRYESYLKLARLRRA